LFLLSIAYLVEEFRVFAGYFDCGAVCSHASITISLVAEAYKMGIVFDKSDRKKFANTPLRNIVSEDRKAAR
jgi:hypothetical protein